jgi:hypothetical protein
MSIEAAIVLLIWLVVIIAFAWVLVYIAGQAGLPPPVPMIIWAVAFLVVLLVLLRHVGLLHATPLLM